MNGKMRIKKRIGINDGVMTRSRDNENERHEKRRGGKGEGGKNKNVTPGEDEADVRCGNYKDDVLGKKEKELTIVESGQKGRMRKKYEDVGNDDNEKNM